MVIFVVAFVGVGVWIVPKLLRLAKRGFQALRDRLSGSKPDRTAPNAGPPPAVMNS